MANMRWLLLPLLLASLSEAYKILVMFPLPGKSHSILGEGVVHHLLEAGHEVTYATPFPRKPHKNLHQIDLTENVKNFSSNMPNIQALMNKEMNLDDPKYLIYMMQSLTKMTLLNENFQKVLNDPNVNFDVAIIEWMFTELASGLSPVLDCPFIWVSTIEPHWLVMRLIDEPLNPAYNADSISSNVAPFTFPQRVKELWSQIVVTFFKEFIMTRTEIPDYEEIFGPLMANKGKPLPPYNEVKYGASLMLGNSHVSLGEATRLPQNYKPIAGYHIDPNVAPLPESLQKIMDNAKNGIIYFSMGSNLKSKDWPEEIKKGLLKMFSGLQQTVLWKFEEALSDLPKNVHILQWAPQHSILSHPNCVLFITHGGLLSTTETVYFGVPIIGIPVFGDQFVNVNRAVRKGFATKVDFTYSLVEELKVAINDMIGNPRYRETVKALSVVYHDRVASPGVELVHWVEHVVRTGGAPHLRSPALHVPWYQKMYLDLIALIIVILYVTKCIIKRICCSKTKISEKLEKKHKKTN